MIDRHFLRQNPKTVKASLVDRGDDPGKVDQFLVLDRQWRDDLKKVELLRREKNQLSAGSKPNATQLRQAKAIAKQEGVLTKRISALESELEEILLSIPNLIDESVPRGAGESANKVIKTVGRPSVKSGLAHHELMTQLGWLDLKTAAHCSGSRFRYLLGDAAVAHWRLMSEALTLARKRGFSPVIPPSVTRYLTLQGAGFFPTYKEDVFKLENEDRYLTGTSEQTLLALSAAKHYLPDELPVRYVGFSTCYRREAGSYGKDVEGMFRQHQFDKVELVSVTRPEDSAKELDYLVQTQEQFVKLLALPYQLVSVGSGDLGQSASKKIDIETWFPSQQRYRETHSASNCTDYQARRLNIKLKRSDPQSEFAHTLNATLATERLLIAAVENSQRSDGSVKLPKLLR